MGISKITRNFQITLPKDVREIKNFHVGEKVMFVVEGDKVDIIKLDKDIIKQTAGLWEGLNETGQEYERRVRKDWAKRRVS